MGSLLAFEWDEANTTHVALHSIAAAEAEQVINNDPLDLEAEVVNGEERITNLGQTDAGRVLIVITTLRGARLRVVTAFPAPKRLIDLFCSETGVPK